MSKPRRKPSPPESAGRETKPRTIPRPDAVTAKSRLEWAVCLGLILTILAVYAPLGHFAFVTYDDPGYITENPHVRAGLTLDSMKYALTSVVSANWMPVTMLSHLTACELFDLQAGWHHRLNEVLHALAAVLLFLVLRRATRSLWPSAFAAAIFALHPLHVESVAWISERKDVLSTCFWFLALYAYVRYTERSNTRGYLLMAAAFCLGLMSKPMLVTFPFTLLLLDVWPLRRFQFPKVLWEKLPLLTLSLIFSGIVYFVQRSAGAVQNLPPGERIANALAWYAGYIGQTFWPTGLAVFYPYPKSIPAWQAAIGLAIVVGVSTLAVLTWRKLPYIATGWFWYVGTLVPVIGLVQVGFQSHADRYMYVPMIGLTIIVAWGAADLLRLWPRLKPVMITAAALSSLSCLIAASAQTDYWRDSESLYRRAIAVTGDNYVAEFSLGDYLMDIPGRGQEAISHFQTSLRIKPDQADAHNSIGAYFLQNGRDAEAIPEFEAALRIKPDLADAHFNLALAFAKIPERVTEAIAQYETALRLKPDLAVAHKNLGMLLLRLGRKTEAVAHFQAAQRLHPDPEITRIMAGLVTGQQ